MIKIQKVLQEISDKMFQADHVKTNSARTKLKNRILHLRMVMRYLETDPTDEYLKGELDRILKRIALIKNDYSEWIPNQQYEKEKEKFNAYCKEMGIPKLRQQSEAIRFILDT